MANDRLYDDIVIQISVDHEKLWRDKDDDYWFYKLLEEVGELGASLANTHEHPPELELSQISSICLNWLNKKTKECPTGGHKLAAEISKHWT